MPNSQKFAVEVNEGVIESSRQGVTWWHLYRHRAERAGRVRETKQACVVGGVSQVDCDSREDAEWLAQHMVNQGGVPRTAVKVKQVKTATRPYVRAERAVPEIDNPSAASAHPDPEASA